MPIIRTKEFTINLEEIIKTRLNSFVNSRKRVYGRRETEFERRVIGEGLGYKEQLDYRKKQLVEERKKAFPHLDFIEELKSEIVNIKKLLRYEKVRQDYLENFTQYKEGKIALTDLIQSLEGQLDIVVDATLRKEILKNLSGARIALADSERAVLDNRVLLAKADKSIPLLNKVISEVQSEMSEANLIGDRETVSSLEVKLLSLNTQKQKLITEDKIHNLELRVIGLTASQKLNLLNDTIAKADTTLPVIVDGRRWGSELEYWQAQRDSYLSGAGKGEFVDFFKEFKGAVQDKVNKLATINRWGYVPISIIRNIDKDYKALAQRPEFSPYVNQLENERVDIIDFALDKTAEAVMSEAEFFGEYQKGFQALRNLEKEFGVDMSAKIGELYYTQIGKIPAQAAALKATAEILARQKGTTPEEEYQKLIAPPIEEKPVEPLGEVLRDVKPEVEPPVAVPSVEEVIPKKEITIPRGATLSGLARQYGTTVAELMKLNPQIRDPDRIFVGARLRLPEVRPEVEPEVKVDVPPAEIKPEVKVEPKIEPKMVAVKRGETLWEIAQRELGAGRRWRELKTPEGIAFTEETAKKLRIGQKLVIPLK